MATKTATKRSLTLSVISMVICIVMLMGTTFAWFTDSVTSGKNMIVAGNLDIELDYWNGESWVTAEGASEIFDSEALWEPGYTEVVYLRLRNAGTLHLKYNVGATVYNEVLGKTKDGVDIRLSEHIKFGVIDNVEKDAYKGDRAAARAACDTGYDLFATLDPANGGYGSLEPDESISFAVVAYMPETVGNEANHNGVNVPSIELGLSVYATQKTAESDTFDKYYDQDASWIGNMAQPYADEYTNGAGTVIYNVSNAAELAWIANYVNSGAAKAAWGDKQMSVILTNDIDLNGLAWTPIGNKAVPFTYEFDGQGYTVSGLNVTGTYAGLFGGIKDNADIHDVNIDGAKVTGVLNDNDDSYAGALVAYADAYLSPYTKISNITVKNAEVYGKTAGGIAGGLYAKADADNCTVTDSIITGKHAGGIVGTMTESSLLTNATVDGNTVYGTDNTGKYIGRNYSSTPTPEDNAIDTTTAVEVSSPAVLACIAEDVNNGDSYKGKTITLTDDLDLAGIEWTPIGNNSTPFKGTFDGNGHTISNLKVDLGNSSNAGLFGMTTDGEIKNLTIENAEVSGRLNVGVVAGTPYTSKYTNITVKGDVKVEGMSYVGAVGGKNAYADITDVTVDVNEGSYVKATSTENGINYRTYVGGVIGFMGEGSHKLTNVTSNIDVIGDVCDIGGIVGIAHYGNSFINCSSSGDVTCTTDMHDGEIGGIAGVWHNGGEDVTFDSCSFTGTLNVPDSYDLTNNTITGVAYGTSGTGSLVIK